MLSKRWWASKTVWYNVAMTALAVANELAPLIDLMSAETQDIVRPLMIIATTMGNLILRLVTKTKVTF